MHPEATSVGGGGGPALVVVVGAGLAGLVAATALEAAGRSVVVLEAAAEVGGRLATRRVGRAVLDSGAQFFTVRSPELGGAVERWEADGLVSVWCRGFGPSPDGHPRYRVEGGMAALARSLAGGLADVRLGTRAERVAPGGDGAGWTVALGVGAGDGAVDAGAVDAAAVVLACPVPSALALLDAGDVSLPPDLARSLRGVTYEPTVSLLAELDGPSALAPPGGLQLEEGPFTFVADGALKGVSPVPGLTLHASPALSRSLAGRPDDAVVAELVAAAGPHLGDAAVVATALDRWAFATPRSPLEERCAAVAGGAAPVVLAGDAHGGPRVEGAYLSGRAAAEAVLAG